MRSNKDIEIRRIKRKKKSIGKEYIDDLTNLYNRRYLNKEIDRILEDSDKRRMPLSIVFIDLDYFKNVNDTYGHSRGDVVLKEFALFLKDLLRQGDLLFRYGGDEFICLLPDINYRQTEKISLRLIEQARLKEFTQIKLTISVGISSFPENAKDWQTLFDIADRNLYSAKRHGRDRIGIFDRGVRELIIPAKEIVGRESELTNIRELTDVIFHGEEGVLYISGEIGVGKTRLVQETLKNPCFRETKFLSSNLSATTKSIPYYPFREIIRVVTNNEGQESIKNVSEIYQIELFKIVPELSDRFNEENGRIFMVDKYRLFEGVRRFLEMQCLNKPLFISLDNIHWADDSSLELLHYLIRSLKKSPIFFFLIFRVEEIKDSKFRNVLQLMERECLCNKIHLEPIEINGVARMLSLILDAKPSTKLLKYIFNETGGNPFFIEELIKSLEENEALIWDTNEWIFNKSKRVVIPSSIEGVVDRKLDMIGEEVQNILEYMAVIGKRFDFSFLQDLTGTNEGHLFDLIDDILEVRLLEESKGETYYFSEDIIREIVYRKINEAKLKHHHQKIGERLLKLHKDHIEEVIEDLANHFYRSGDLEKALKYSIVAGDRASDSYANTDAIRFYTWAIDCLKEGKIEDKELKQIECLENRANVLKLNGEAEKALEDLELAIKLSEEIGNRKEEADCLIILSKVYQDISRYNEATRMAEKALTIFRKLKDRDGEAESIGNTANIYFYLGEYQKALEFNQRSLKIRKEIANSQGQASILNSIGIIYQSLGNYSEALKFFQDSLEIIEVIGDRKLKATNLNNIGIINYNLGNYSDALNLYKRSLDIFRDMGDRKGAARGLANIGSIYHVLGKYSKAFEFYANSLKIIEEIGDISGVATILHNMGLVSYSLYDHNKALELYKRSLGIVEEIGDKKIELANLSCIGDIYLEMDDFPVAERYLNKAYSIAREIKSKSLLTYVLLHLANFYLRKDNLAEVKRILKGIFTLVDEIGTKEYKAGAFSVSGLVYTKEKKWKKATSAFKEAISIFKKLETEFDLAKVYYHFGLMLKASGDKTNAKKYFTKAKKIFKKVKASEWIKKIETDNKKSKP